MMNKEEELVFLKDFLEKTKKLTGDCSEVEDFFDKEDYKSAFFIIEDKLEILKKEVEVLEKEFKKYYWIFVQ